MVKRKDSSERLLRALDGENLHLEAELRDLLQLGNRVRSAVPAISPLDEAVRRGIWNDVVSGAAEPAVPDRRAGGFPRLAWGIAAAIALAAIAVLVLVFVNVGVKPIIEPGGIARLWPVRGEMRILSPQGEVRTAGEGEILKDGDSIIALGDARGVVEFDEGSIMRLDGEAEIALFSGEGEVTADIARGRSYHRVVDGSSYVVRSGGVKVTAEGTAFTFDIGEDTGKVMSLQSQVKVEVSTLSIADWSSSLEEGKVFLYREGDPEALISDVSRNDLDNEWLRWNKSLDENLGLPLGVLSQLDEGEIADGLPVPSPGDQGTTPTEDGQPAPGPSPAPAPEPVPEPQPTPEPQPGEKGVVLSAQAGEDLVSLSWTVTGYSGFQGFKLCRSETNPSPAYPNDWWKYVDGENTRSDWDDTVLAGHTYYYRVGVYDGGSVLGYSNTVQITVTDQPFDRSITLNASVEAGKVNLSWQISGQGAYDGFKVCRSESNSNPGYPAEGIAYVTSGLSYADTGVTPGHTYYYRVGIYRAGSILKYSNAIQVTVPDQPQELSITLDATVYVGKVDLSWQVSGQGAYDGFKVCRSETNPNPSYPAEWIAYITSGFSYSDTGVTPGHTYYYRVGIYKAGTILKYSNAIQVTVP